MKQSKKEDYLMVVSAVVAILASKIADALLPSSVKIVLLSNLTKQIIPQNKMINNVASAVDPWLGLIVSLAIIIVITVIIILPIVKYLTKKTIFIEEDSKKKK